MHLTKRATCNLCVNCKDKGGGGGAEISWTSFCASKYRSYLNESAVNGIRAEGVGMNGGKRWWTRQIALRSPFSLYLLRPFTLCTLPFARRPAITRNTFLLCKYCGRWCLKTFTRLVNSSLCRSVAWFRSLSDIVPLFAAVLPLSVLFLWI